MLLYAVCYGVGGVSFLLLIALMLVRQVPRGIGLAILGVYALTALWAIAGALQPWCPPGIAHLLDGVRTSAWLMFLAFVFVTVGRGDGERTSPLYTFIVPLISFVVIANDLRFVLTTAAPTDLVASQVFCRIAMAVCGLLLVENLFRNTLPARRWHVLPLCIAVGSLFAYELVVFSAAVITRAVDPVLLAGRGIVLALIVPPLIVTMARNQTWNIDIHVSRRAAFHTATLTIAGVFLLLAAAVAGFVGRFPGDWGALLRLTVLAGSVVALAMILTVGSLRSRLRRVLSENFFSARYDYREEWIRCIATLSSSTDRDSLQERVIRALADVVDSPGGELWLRHSDGRYRVAATLNFMAGGASAEEESGAFVSAFAEGKTVQVFATAAERDAAPAWVRDNDQAWLAVPLVMADEVLGFIVLASPRAPMTLNWESYDLLLTIGRQGASWLAEELAARALADSQLLFEYSKRFSFVAHDVKNVSSQLGIMIANMKQFGDQPEFRADMVKTMEASIQRLNALLGKLTVKQNTPSQAVDLAKLIESVQHNLNNAAVRFEKDGAAPLCETISDQDLQSVLTHVITNAVEASEAGSPVLVKLNSAVGIATITVEDKGQGMDPAFVRDQLFTPLRTTKQGGHGIGAYQARELVRAAGGAFDVISVPRQGTCVRITLPLIRQAAAARSVSQGAQSVTAP